MKYAMTGATGFLGGALARLLVAEGHDVVAVVRSPGKARWLRDAGVAVHAADLFDVAGMSAAFRGADGVFHVAGWYKVGSRHPQEAWQVNVEGTKNALAAARNAGVPRVVYTSTCAVNSDTGGRTVDETYRFTGTHLTVYDETKARAHDYALQFARRPDAPEVVIMMPGGIYGPGDTSQVGGLMRQVAHGKRVVGSSHLRLVQAQVDDVATGHRLGMDLGRHGESYMLAGERTDLLAMLAEVAALTGGPSPIDVPAAVVPVAERVLGLVGRVVPLPGEYSAESMRSLRASYLGSPAKAQRELGWRFRGLHEGLADTVAAEGWSHG